MYICFFAGHRDTPSYIQEQLDDTVDYLVTKCNVTEFIVGHYGNFDRMATLAVQRVIQRRPEKEVIAVLLEPYFPEDLKVVVPNYFEDIFYPEGMEDVPRRFCIEKANQKALNQADYLVAYVCRNGGNAAKLLRSAKRMEKDGYISVINLGDL